MPIKPLKVELLARTPDALALIYAAFRQCYHAGFVADMWPRLTQGEVDREAQADFVRKVLESGHDSPIEHASFTFAVEGISRACSHQIVRHRI
ncbi:MAG: FAD-dependent thymidylate synthase, partial [Humidesulfovibrio sp.]|nr:FAD-dependent thymidylate synthase [Humidesulfovibrio sp.]